MFDGVVQRFLSQLARPQGHPPHWWPALPPMTQGKIERYHRPMKNRILLENYYLPGELELNIGEFVTYYNNRRYHESLDNRIYNLTPADVYFGRGPTILKRRESIKPKPSNNDVACISRQSLPEPLNQMSQMLS